MTIGRGTLNDICVSQDSVSRTHAILRATTTACGIRDNESTNGTYVNDHKVHEAYLKDGDLVKIGRSIFKFLTGDNIESLYHEEIYRLSTVDGLTQIFNKRYFLETLERELSRARRYDRPLALVMFDIDYFKRATTRTATAPATSCCARSRTWSAIGRARSTWWPATAARSSR
jgi:two-component system cell cycle response regulator